jgi:hypothetical protein
VPSENQLIAVDLALVPPEWVQQRARAINAHLLDHSAGGFRFDATHVPHISLVQQFVHTGKLPALIDAFNPILQATAPLAIRVSGIVGSASTVSFSLERTPLVSLHERLMDAALPLEEAAGTAQAFFSDGEAPRVKDLEWVAAYRAQAAYSAFAPHITLGIGATPAPGEPFDFIAGRAGLFHLGRFCTCRRLLHVWALSPL